MYKDVMLILLLASSAVTIILILLLMKRKENDYSQQLKELEKSSAVLTGKLCSIDENLGKSFSAMRMEQEQRTGLLRKEIHDNMENLSNNIRKLGSEAYEQRIKTDKIIGEFLERMRVSNEDSVQKQNILITEYLEKMMESNEKKLEQMRITVDEKLTATLSERLDTSFKTVSDQLTNLYKSLGEMKELSSGVTANVTSLNRVLTNVKVRGTWAEIQLEGILDQTIPGMYEKNVMTVPNSLSRVEFAVKIPSNENKGEFSYLPIDSKFPMEDYARLCSFADEGNMSGIQEARKALERNVLNCAKDISKYINEPKTTSFAIMYLATEGLYSEIVSSSSGVAEKIQSEYKVIISGPGTITALLNSLSMGFRAIAINEKANEVRKLLGAIKGQYSKFGDLLAKAKKEIEKVDNTIGDAKSRNDIIQRKLKSVEELEYSSATQILGIEEENE